MALKRETLKTIGLTEGQVTSIIDGHNQAYAEYREKYGGNAGNGLTGGGKSGKIEAGAVFHSKGDPMYEVMGSAFESHPKEVQQMIDTLTEWGVGINYGESNLGYGSRILGVPGTMSVTHEASYSAWLHEFEHAKDDKEAGWNAAVSVWDTKEHIRREINAYSKEIELAKSLNMPEMVKRLEENLDEAIREIRERDERYKEIYNADKERPRQ